MISILAYIFAVALLVAFTALLLRNAKLSAELLATEADRDRLFNSVSHNLRGIRAHVAYAFPEAAKVCDVLETTLRARCRADFDGLERALVALRRAHNAAILEGANSGEPYRTALRDLLALVREDVTAFEWEKLERFDAILAAPRAAPVRLPWTTAVSLRAEGGQS